MTTTLYFVRHGEVHNPKGILYVRLPRFRLSKRGREEVTETAQFLKTKPITQLYSSPLLRARQTAKIIQEKLHLPDMHISKKILEVRTSYEGKLFSDLDPKQFCVYEKPLKKTDETIEQIGKRMVAFVDEMVTKYPGEHIVVCSHGDPIMILAAMIEKKELTAQSVKGGVYIKHGEVFALTDNNGKRTIKSVFIP